MDCGIGAFGGNHRSLGLKDLGADGSKPSQHLKAYGVAFWVLGDGVEVEWLLNYRGGSFLMPNIAEINECVIRGVSYQVIADVQASQILTEIADPEVNMERVKLEVSQSGRVQPGWQATMG